MYICSVFINTSHKIIFSDRAYCTSWVIIIRKYIFCLYEVSKYKLNRPLNYWLCISWGISNLLIFT